jgi:alpha-beta hydrolase superfamily lysophospholipase
MATVRADHRTVVDADGVTIHFTVWAPPKPRAIVQISHGQGDHSQRYASFAEELAAHGFAVYADDHRGHGETWREQWKSDTAKLGHLGPRGVRGTLDAINLVTSLARSEHPGLPLCFLGHSMGSLLGQKALAEGSLDADLVIWTGTALRTPFTMNSGDLNKFHKHLGNTGHEWLSRDVAVHTAFAADPLTFKAEVMKQFGLADSVRLLGFPTSPARDVPLLIAIGSEDSLGTEKSVADLANRYLKVGFSDVTLVVYEGARHEILNETNKAEIRGDIVHWIDAHLAELAA